MPQKLIPWTLIAHWVLLKLYLQTTSFPLVFGNSNTLVILAKKLYYERYGIVFDSFLYAKLILDSLVFVTKAIKFHKINGRSPQSAEYC